MPLYDIVNLDAKQSFRIYPSCADTLLVVTKVVQIIKCTCTVFIDNFKNISTNSSIIGISL